MGDVGDTVSVIDVAKYILGQSDEPMTTMKLQKLCYYSQAWHVAWHGRRLFPEDFQAWANGPVCRPLFAEHRGRLLIDAASFPVGDPENLGPRHRQVINDVLKAYLPLTGAQLSDLTHAEKPWNDARAGLAPSAKSTKVITPKAMKDYYGSLREEDPAVKAVEDMTWPDDPWND